MLSLNTYSRKAILVGLICFLSDIRIDSNGHRTGLPEIIDYIVIIEERFCSFVYQQDSLFAHKLRQPKKRFGTDLYLGFPMKLLTLLTINALIKLLRVKDDVVNILSWLPSKPTGSVACFSRSHMLSHLIHLNKHISPSSDRPISHFWGDPNRAIHWPSHEPHLHLEAICRSILCAWSPVGLKLCRSICSPQRHPAYPGCFRILCWRRPDVRSL